jgi:S1-C subfamily serine protease
MLSASKVSVCGLWTYGILAVLVACVVLAGIAYPVPETAGQDAAAAEGAPEDQFDSPEAIISRFSAELGRLASSPGIPSPNELAQQAAVNKTCAVAALPDTGKKLDAQTIYARARAGVVIVGAIPRAKKRHQSQPVFATGFVIHKDGVIVSNGHVLEAFRDMKAVGVMTSDGRVFAIKAVLAADRLNDAAVLKVEATNLTPLPLAKSVPVGTTVYCLSHPVMNGMGTEHGFFAFTQGIVSGRYRTRLMGETPVNVLTITADYAQGSSGGPILNECGAVVGIVCQTLAIEDEEGGSQMTWKFARPSSSILLLLQGGQAGNQLQPRVD